MVFSIPAICAGIIYIKLEHLGLFPASKLAQASYYLLLPSIDFYWDFPPLKLPVKILVVHFLVLLGFFYPFLFPFRSLYNSSVFYFVFVFSHNAPFVFEYFLSANTKNTFVVAVVIV